MTSKTNLSSHSIAYIAKVKSQSRLDEDYQRKSYYISDPSINLLVFAKAPQLYTLQQSYFSLLYHSRKVILDEKYVMRPDLLSYDEYGDESLWYVLLYVNNCFCFEDFTGPEIYIPDYDAISSIVELQVPDKESVEAVINASK